MAPPFLVHLGRNRRAALVCAAEYFAILHKCHESSKVQSAKRRQTVPDTHSLGGTALVVPPVFGTELRIERLVASAQSQLTINPRMPASGQRATFHIAANASSRSPSSPCSQFQFCSAQ